MKIKKLLIAAIAVTTMFASCSKDDDSNENGKKVLTISLTNPATQGRAISGAGTAQKATITDGDGIIFILDAADNVKQAVAFATTFPGAVQAITNVAASDKVYIIANIGSTNVTAWTGTSKPTTLTELKALSIGIDNAANGQDYTKATIANVGGTPVGITVGEGATASARIEVQPVYSRLELGSVKAKATSTITDFTVSGVYVDEYYPNYTMGLSYAGTLFEQLLNAATFGQIAEMKDEGSWAAAAQMAKPETGKWVYNVPSGNMPRLIIKLTNLSGTLNGQTLTNAVGPYFLTIADYGTPGSTTTFLPARIYDITDGIEFDHTNIGATPNAKMVTLTVEIDILLWDVDDLTANLM